MRSKTQVWWDGWDRHPTGEVKMRSRGEAEMTTQLARTAEKQHHSSSMLGGQAWKARTTAAQGSQGRAREMKSLPHQPTSAF